MSEDRQAHRAELQSILDRLAPWQAPEAMQVTLGASCFAPGSTPEQVREFFDSLHAPLFHQLGATSWESYVTYAGCSPAPGEWDFTIYDTEADYLREHGLKWVPFLIAGPNYATPAWYRDSDASVKYVCLEHNEPSGVESLWNPAWRDHVVAFLTAFAERYRDQGLIESVLLGVTGDFGESIYPVSGGGWTGDYHQHAGYWAGDKFAQASFRNWCESHYPSLAALNATWRTDFADFSDIEPFLPDARPSDRAWLDFVDWYKTSMNDWSEFWLKTTRELFPSDLIYLCTGGDADPQHGSDFTDQSKLAARYQAGVRITNEGSDYQKNFLLTRWVGSACKHYGAYFGYEPAGPVNAYGFAARVYNVMASGADQLFEYTGNFIKETALFERFASELRKLRPVVPAVKCAAFIPSLEGRLKPDAWWDTCFEPYYMLRDLVDFDLVDTRMLLDNAVANHKLVFWLNGSNVENALADSVQNWLSRGGVLVTRGTSTFKLWGPTGFLRSMKVSDLVMPVPLLDDSGQAIATVFYAYSGGVCEVLEPAVPEAFPDRLVSVLRVLRKHFPSLNDLPLPDLAADKVFVTLTDNELLALNANAQSLPLTLTIGKTEHQLEASPETFSTKNIH